MSRSSLLSFVYIYIYIYIANCFHPDSKPIFLPSFFFLFHLGSYAYARYPDIGSKVRTGGGDRGKNALNQGPEAGKIKHV